MSEDDPKTAGKPRKERPPKVVTADLLRRQALRYLDRFAATTLKLRRHLFNKNAKAIEFHDQDPEAVQLLIDQEIEKLEKAGILDDQEYASGKARSMARQGKSGLQIGMKLGSLGFNEEQSDHALERLREEEGYTERKAAAKYIRKRRFGPFKPLETRDERLQKELASLVRNGFEYSMAKSLLLLENPEDIDTIIYSSD